MQKGVKQRMITHDLLITPNFPSCFGLRQVHYTADKASGSTSGEKLRGAAGLQVEGISWSHNSLGS